MNISSVLLVDDDEDIRAIGKTSLANVGGWRVWTAASGREAIAQARAETPDLIVLDVMMPGMDGPTTLAELRAHDATRHIPVIFLTAKAQRHEVHRLESLGGAGVLTKPFDPMALPEAIRDLLTCRTERQPRRESEA
ncbi:MAG: response regulator [Candidatus Schekmanbacteria bacterium]|nr:response regulator [Candidatus Schekmanbacteria bacterium]